MGLSLRLTSVSATVAGIFWYASSQDMAIDVPTRNITMAVVSADFNRI